MPQPKDDLSQSLTALEQGRTLTAVVELGVAAWLVGGIVPGIEREPMKTIARDAKLLLGLMRKPRFGCAVGIGG